MAPIAKPDEDHADRDRGVPRHVGEGAADIQVALAPGHEEQRRDRIDHHAGGRHPHHGFAGHFFGMRNALEGFPCDPADDDQQHDGIGERREHRGTPPAVGAMLRGREFADVQSAPRDEQAKDIAQIMPRIREQREGVRGKAIDNLGHDEAEVEQDSDGESKVVARRGVRVAVVVSGMVVRHGRGGR